ncbi:MAG: TetR/AcrR family transcriptional regulator [Ignavibacteriales bacterium]
MIGFNRRERDRQTRRAEIIAAAEKVFFESGFDGATMDEIARVAQFTKRTVYQYFKDKEDLYFAVALKCVSELRAYVQRAVEAASTGVTKIRLLSEAYYRFSKDSPDAFRLINHASQVAAQRTTGGQPREITRVGTGVYQELADVIAVGQRDGSIRTDLEAAEGAFSVFLLITGFFYRLSLVGGAYEEAYGASEDRLARLGIDLLERAIRAGEQPRSW